MSRIQRSQYNNPETFLDDVRRRALLALLSFSTIVTFLELLRLTLRGNELQLTQTLSFVLSSFFLVLLIRSGGNLLDLLAPITLLLFGALLFTTTLLGSIVGLSLLLLVLAIFARNRIIYFAVVTVVLARVILYDVPRLAEVDTLFQLSFPFITGMLLVSVVLRRFVARFEHLLFELRRGDDLLSATATIGQVIGQYLELQPLLDRTVNALRDRLGYYHVQVFLANETNTRAYVAASTGEVGRLLLTQKRSIALNENNIIARAMQSGESLIVMDTKPLLGGIFSDLLPNTRSQLVLPIVEGERIVGALDIQSMRVNAFTRNDVQAIEVMTSQLATAIRNARLFDEQERTIRENKRLFLEAETNLREIERLNRQLTKQVWDDYLSGRGVVSGVTWSRQEFRPGAEWTQTMMQAAQRRRPMTVEQHDEHKRTIAVPIELRGEVIGAIEIETTAELLATETVDLLQAISQRLGISLDNARLFEETQEATAQEQRIGEIVAEYQSAKNIEDLLQITVEGLAEALGAERGAIRLGKMPDTIAQNGHAGGN